MLEIHAGSMTKMLADILGDVDRDAALVMIEIDGNGGRARLQGLDISLKLAREGKRVLMIGWQTPAAYASTPLWHACIEMPNVVFAQLPVGAAEIKALLTEDTKSGPADPLALRLLELSNEVDVLRVLKHNANYIEQRDEDAQLHFLTNAKKLFGDLSLEELKTAVNEAKADTPVSACAGEEFPDVFVDIENTLLQNGELNQALLKQINELAATHPITVWSGGDLKILEPQLRSLGITYKVASKHALRGAKVAIAFDDLPYGEFFAEYGITVDQYIQV